MEWDLLEKTTFWIEDIELADANLGAVAGAAAVALGLDTEEVMVVDVRPGLVAFDVMRRRVEAEAVAGREKEILQRLKELPGVKLGPAASVHSEGVLGLIALGEKEAARVLADSAQMAADISKAVSRRAMVFASGSEVMAGKIQDTNSPYIINALQEAGYQAKFGGILADDALPAARSIEAVLEQGYGLIITTGGVGAEDKDFSIEAVCRLDPDACTPWILKFKPDYHRHHKEGVRIAVGQAGIAKLVALPGPHEEAALGCDRLIEGLQQGLDKAGLAEYIAAALRQRWQNMMNKGGHANGLSNHRR
ncbi:molybdopterin-binding protein [Desulfotomaculum copahuensis]|uniref:Molybdopterin-binding protein n=1 Tax=Desulfotomaculum copahuensis TaxID=1838280 RepID=A0A1B7LIJ2_9FIRM|nr:molybdopterin-binding protein [Desulfotomaculum copahuensis]OAT86390.1 molybdopterin-binding protein [Desulfotomaculum copahuensis]